MQSGFKDRVLEVTDIVEVIGERVSLVRKGKDYMGLCPFHQDHNPSMSVSPKKQIFKCWSCGAGGDVIKFVQLRDRLEFPEALATLARRAGIEIREGSAVVDQAAARARDDLRHLMDWARDRFQANLKDTDGGRLATDYARRRGLSEDTIRRHRLGYAPDAWDDLVRAAGRAGVALELAEQAGLIGVSEKGKPYDRFRNRLIFPIADGLGRTVAFGGRTLGDDPAKYLNSPETPLFSKSRILYGLDLAREAIEKQGGAIVVEGYLDAVLLHQYGFEQTVATLGTALTAAHVKLLKPLTNTVYLCFDGDSAGMKAADRAVEIALGGKIDVRVIVLPEEQDPADLVVLSGAPAFSSRLQSAVDALEFKWSLTLKTFGDGGVRTRRAAAEQMLQFVASAGAAGGIDPLEQGMMVGRLSELLSLPVASVYDLLARAKGAARRESSSNTLDTSETSAYGASIRGLPPGITATVEDLFGLMLCEPQRFGWTDDAFGAAVGHCETWKRLDSICREMYDEFGAYTRADVLARCEDAALCELVARASARSGSVFQESFFDVTRERLASELDLLHMGDLRGALRTAPASDAGGQDAFRSFLTAARRQHGFLAAEVRQNVTGS